MYTQYQYAFQFLPFCPLYMKKKKTYNNSLYISAHLTQNPQKSTETAGFTPAVPVDFRSFYILSTFFPPFPDTADTVCRHLPLPLQTVPSLP